MRESSARHGATRVLFGKGASARLAAEVDALGLERVLVVCTQGRRVDAIALCASLGPRLA